MSSEMSCLTKDCGKEVSTLLHAAGYGKCEECLDMLGSVFRCQYPECPNLHIPDCSSDTDCSTDTDLCQQCYKEYRLQCLYCEGPAVVKAEKAVNDGIVVCDRHNPSYLATGLEVTVTS